MNKKQNDKTTGGTNAGLVMVGWNQRFTTEYSATGHEAGVPGRVIRAAHGIYFVRCASGEKTARVTGAFEYRASGPADFPVVGDWVVMEESEGGDPRITAVLPRSGTISRKSAGEETVEQVLAANVDIVFITFSLEGERTAHPRAAERYATMAWESGAQPVILLNKADLATDLDDRIAEIEAVTPGVDIIPTSCTVEFGIDRVAALLSDGKTGVLVGPSGVGKTTLTNLLLREDRYATRTVRAVDSKGRHTTTSRELAVVPTGGVIIDTPGLRELQLWAGSGALEESFSDIAEIAADCRFRDCTHGGEPGCAVQAALADGNLDHRRYENFLDLTRELAYLERKTSEQSRREERLRWKQINKQMRGYTKEKRSSG